MTQSDDGGRRDLSGLELEDRAATLVAMMGAVQRAVFATLVELERLEWWRQDGVRSMAAWVATRYGLSPRTAHDWLRIAHALESMPALDAAFRNGMLSLEQLSHATRIAEVAGDDATVADAAVGQSVAELRRLAQLAERVDPEDRDEAHRRRSLRIRWNHDRLGAHLHGFLPNDAAAIVERAPDTRIERNGTDPDTGVHLPYATQLADALVEICSRGTG